MPPSASQRGADRLELEAGLDEHDDREGGVGRHVPADQRLARHERAAVGAGEPELGVRGRLVEDLDDPVGARRRRAACPTCDGRDRDARLVDDALRPRPCRGETTPRLPRSGWNSGELRLEVLLHVGVVVEVVVAEVGEGDDVEDEAVDAVAGERLGAHLDRDGAHLGLAHAGEQRVHLARLGRGQPADDGEVADVALRGRAEPGDEAELPQDRLEQVRRRGLAVRAGGAEQQRRVARRCGRPTRRSRRARRAGSIDDQDGQARVGCELGARGVGQERRPRRPRLRRRGDTRRRGCSRPGCRRRGRRAAGRRCSSVTPVISTPSTEPRCSRPNSCDELGRATAATGCSGRRTGGIRAVTLPASFPLSDPLPARGRRRLPGTGMFGAGVVDGWIRKVLMTCFMMFAKAGAAAAEVFIVSGLARVTTTAYCGFSAGIMPATETMRSLAVRAVLGDLRRARLGGDAVAGDADERCCREPWVTTVSSIGAPSGRRVLARRPACPSARRAGR